MGLIFSSRSLLTNNIPLKEDSSLSARSLSPDGEVPFDAKLPGTWARAPSVKVLTQSIVTPWDVLDPASYPVKSPAAVEWLLQKIDKRRPPGLTAITSPPSDDSADIEAFLCLGH